MAYATPAMLDLARRWEAAIPSAVFSGIVGDAAHGFGYHRAAAEIPTSDYSRQLSADRSGIDPNAADAIDMSMSTADMITVTRRVYNSWRDQDDPRLNGWREFIGTLDGRTVIYMDCQNGQQGTADLSHVWHAHAGGLRANANNPQVMNALLSVVTGESLAAWQARSGEGDDMSAAEVKQILDAVGGWYERLMVGRTKADAAGFKMANLVDLAATTAALNTQLGDVRKQVTGLSSLGTQMGEVRQQVEGLRQHVEAARTATTLSAEQVAQLAAALGPVIRDVVRAELNALDIVVNRPTGQA